nr:MAG TPA: hypothetical protein [Bacteriophage sp.]
MISPTSFGLVVERSLVLLYEFVLSKASLLIAILKVSSN